MTAGRLCAEIVAQKSLSRDIDWVLFEVIDGGAMGESSRSFQSVIHLSVRFSYQALAAINHMANMNCSRAQDLQNR